MASPAASSRTAKEEVFTSGGGGEPSSASNTPKTQAVDMSRNASRMTYTNEDRRAASSASHSHSHHHHPHLHHSQHRSTASRMPRTLNTIPVWARKDDDSPPPSPRSSSPPSQKRSSNQTTASTWPKAPKSAFLQSSQINSNKNKRRNERGSIDESRPMTGGGSSSDDHSGPSRFWSFTMPHLFAGGGGEGSSGGGRRRETTDDSSDDSHDGQGEGQGDRDRRPSLTNAFTATLGGAFSTLASGAYMGGQALTGKKSSQRDSEEEKQQQDEQGDVDPLSAQWSQDETTPSDGRDAKRERRDAEKREKEAVDRQRGVEWDSSFSRHHQLTPGWDSPWQPEARGGNSIEIGRYRYNNFGVGGYFPRVDTNRSNGSTKKKRMPGKNGMSILHSRKESTSSALITLEWWQKFLLDNPFVPLLFRMINVAFTSSTLAIAIRLHIILKSQGAEESVGSSPIVAIIFSPLTLLHVGIQIWLEYFSRPIGLWRVGSKLFYTLIELIFVCLWSAELSLSLDNYFTSTLVCTTLNSPYTGSNNGVTLSPGQVLNDPSTKPNICALQRALIGLVFVSLIAYVVTLTVSLFRIFVRVSRR